MPPSSPVLDRAGCWFLNSGIQESGGGVARYYRTDVSQNARVSTEITGYAASALVYLFSRTGNGAYLDAAVRAGDFLIDRAWDRDLRIFPFEFHSDGLAPEPLAYFFDSGIIARGLLALWRAASRERYLSAAVACGDSMIREFASGPRIHPVLRLPSKTALPYEPRWSRSPGCYQLKSALAWQDLYEATGETRFAEAYRQALADALGSAPGFLEDGQRERVMDRLHAWGYFLEGMLPCAARPDCAAATRGGIARMARLVREIAPVFVRSDVYAQLLRARLFADASGVEPLDREAAAYEAEQAAAFQLGHADPRIRHGFWFGRKGGELLPFVNPVSTAFCLQALDMWQQYEEGAFRADRQALI